MRDAACNPLNAISALLSLATLLAALYIPRKIMLDQLYADFVSQYRSPVVGVAILSIFDFYAHDCENNSSLQ